MDSYYTLLKVTRESKFPEDATKAYRKLALRAHPDKGGSKEAFDALHRAYEVLKEEEKRQHDAQQRESYRMICITILFIVFASPAD